MLNPVIILSNNSFFVFLDENNKAIKVIFPKGGLGVWHSGQTEEAKTGTEIREEFSRHFHPRTSLPIYYQLISIETHDVAANYHFLIPSRRSRKKKENGNLSISEEIFSCRRRRFHPPTLPLHPSPRSSPRRLRALRHRSSASAEGDFRWTFSGQEA